MKKSFALSALSLSLFLHVGNTSVYAQATPPAAPSDVTAGRPIVTLKVGDAAPKIYAAKWLKGKPVNTFKKGHVYAIEFWATWCGPCRAAMPHLTELAHKYKNDVTIVGFNVQELIAADDKMGDYFTKVENFVNNLGDGMDYPVAVDDREGNMWNNWMKAAGLGGIPSTFVIDQKGKIAWIGHPSNLDDVLKLVVEKKYTPEAFVALRKIKGQKIAAFTAEWEKVKSTKDYNKIIALADDMMVNVPGNKSNYIVAKYEAFKAVDAAKAEQYIQFIAKENANDPLLLQSISKAISETGTPLEIEVAVAIMELAITRCAPDDPYAYSNLAAIYFKNNNIEKAVATQEKVVTILADTTLVKQKQTVIDNATALLEKYKTAL